MEIDIKEVKNNKENKEYILEVVKKQGKLLEFASEELQDDEEVVIEALKQDGEALEFASDRLKDQKRNCNACNEISSLDCILCK